MWWVATAALLVGASRAQGDPIVILKPIAFTELLDFAPIDGGSLEQAQAQNVALGPGAESRVFYQFPLPPLRPKPRSPVVFTATRDSGVFSECALLSPCPDLTRVDIYGFASNGLTTLADYDAGTFLAAVTSIPKRGQAIDVDVTAFISGLLGQTDFAGFVLRPGSAGALGFSGAQLSATPEPGSLSLLTIAAIGAIGRQWQSRRSAGRTRRDA